MFIQFTPHFIKLKDNVFSELQKQSIIPSNRDNSFPVLAMDVKTSKGNYAEKTENDDEEDIVYKEVEVVEIMLLIGIAGYGYYWVDQDEIIFQNTSKPILH